MRVPDELVEKAAKAAAETPDDLGAHLVWERMDERNTARVLYLTEARAMLDAVLPDILATRDAQWESILEWEPGVGMCTNGSPPPTLYEDLPE